MKNALRLLLVLLFLLSMLTWFSVQSLFAWELSIVTTQLGWIFAIITLACIGALLITRIRAVDVVILALAVVALGTYVAPIYMALVQYPGQMSLAQLVRPVESAVPFKRFQYTAANDKTPLNLDVYSPPTPAVGKPSPWILVVHGGGWINGNSEQMSEMNWHLAKEGYTVVSIDYRLSPGWLWPAPKDDSMRALAFVKAHATEWNIDFSRWAIIGRSAGAQIAGCVAYTLHGDERPKGFVSYYNPTDLVFGYGVGQEDDILKSRTLLRGFLGGTPEEKKALYESASEMNLVTPDAAPTLLLHGLKDNIVWEKHSERLFDVLKKNKVDATMMLLAFGPHGFDYFFNGPEAQVATNAADTFLRRVLPL